MRSLRWLASAAFGAIAVMLAEGQEYSAYDEEYKMLMNKMMKELNTVNAQTEAVRQERLQWEALAAAKEDQVRQEELPAEPPVEKMSTNEEVDSAEELPAAPPVTEMSTSQEEELPAAPPVATMPASQEIDSAEVVRQPDAPEEMLPPPPVIAKPQTEKAQALASHHRRHFRHFRPRKRHHPLQRLRGAKADHHHHKASLYNLQTLLYRAELEEQEQENLEDEDAGTQYAADPLPTLPPRYHPLTRRELRRMGAEVKNLEDRKSHLEKDRDDLAATRSDATMHLSDAVTIQRSEVQAETKIRKAEHKETQLHEEEIHIQQEHEQLAARLHGVMDPKIRFANQRLQKEQQLLAKAQMQEGRWSQELNKNKAAAIAKLKAKKQAYARLQASEKAVEDANREHKTAEQAYDVARNEASQGVELFRVSNTRHSGAVAEQDERARAAQEAQVSLQKMQNVLNLESKQVDNSLAANEKKITGKIHFAEQERAKALKEDEKLKKNMEAWKAEERHRAEKAAEKKKSYDGKLKAYNSDRTHVYTGAEDSAGKKAEVTSDWDWGDWAWAPSDSKVVDDEEVHLGA